MIAAYGPHWPPACRASFADTTEFTRLLDGLDIELLKLKHENGQHWIASARHGRTRILIVHLTGRYRMQIRVPERHILVQVERGNGSTRTLAGVSLKGEQILVGRSPVEFDTVLSGPHESVALLMDEAEFLPALAVRAPGLDEVICATSSHVLSGCRYRLGRFTRAAVAALEQPHNESLSQSDLVDSVVEVLVDAFERTSHAKSSGSWFQRRPIVQRVEEFMTDNLGQPIRLETLCQVARASRRTVEYAFSTTYGMGPKQYLALLRLNEVNRHLRSGSAGTILQIAGSCGFQHMGHLSSQYRRLFGETPRQTQTRTLGAACRGALAMTGRTVRPDAIRPEGQFTTTSLADEEGGQKLPLRARSMQSFLSTSQ